MSIGVGGSNHDRWEVHKIAIGAFYAICMQRAFETVIDVLKHNPVAWDHKSFAPYPMLGQIQVLLTLQFVAYVIWLGLFYIENVRLYFRVPYNSTAHRILTHGLLTASLGQLYFVGATIGDPSETQLYLILSILILDGLFPLFLGSSLQKSARRWWVIRGALQTLVFGTLIVVVEPEHYRDVLWSGLFLGLMCLQLFIAPLEARRH